MNFGEIKAAIKGRTHRRDLDSFLPEFITLAETEYNQRTDSSYSISGADTVHNWLSDTAPLVYIYGGLLQAALQTRDDAEAQKYAALFDRAIADAHYTEVKESGITSEPLTTDLVASGSYNILTDE